jgi:hypothetical protein
MDVTSSVCMVGQLLSRNCQALRRWRSCVTACVKAIGRDGAQRPGTYLMTVFWRDGGWSEVPDQSKDHHLIALDTGRWTAYPNNRLLWSDPSWISGEVPRGLAKLRQLLTAPAAGRP